MEPISFSHWYSNGSFFIILIPFRYFWNFDLFFLSGFVSDRSRFSRFRAFSNCFWDLIFTLGDGYCFRYSQDTASSTLWCYCSFLPVLGTEPKQEVILFSGTERVPAPALELQIIALIKSPVLPSSQFWSKSSCVGAVMELTRRCWVGVGRAVSSLESPVLKQNLNISAELAAQFIK